MTVNLAHPSNEDDEIPRDRWDRPMVIPPGGGKPVGYTRCTTFIKALDDTHNLMKWKARIVAAGMGQRHDLVAEAAGAGVKDSKDPGYKSWRSKLDDIAETAAEAGGGSKARRIGTALHAFTERLDRGQPVGAVPADLRPHLKNYETATAPLTAAHIEQFTVNDDLRIGGTPDRIVTAQGEPGLLVADTKSGNVDYSASTIAMQLAVYAHSQLYAHPGQRATIEGLRTDRGIVIDIDAKTGDCRLLWIDLTQAWAAVDLARQVRDWRKLKAAHFLGDFTPAPAGLTAEQDAALRHAINSAPTVAQLTELWATAGAGWTDEHTQLAQARRAEVEGAAA